MNCDRVHYSLSAYCDGRLTAQERAVIASHLAGCAECAAASERLSRMRGALRELPKLSPPEDLSTSLRVLASREAARRTSRTTLATFLTHVTARTRLWIDDVMRPIALPLAGGFVSAVILFAMLMPTFAQPRNSGAQDVPTVLSTAATVYRMGPFGLNEDDIVLDLTIDEQGRVIDYSIPSGQAWSENPQVKRDIENLLLSIEFNPSTVFGQPTSGKVRISFRRSEIDVKG